MQANRAAAVSGISRRTIWQWVAVVVALALLAVGPLFLNGYLVSVLTEIFMMTVVTASINLMVGFAGYPAFGNVVFFGVGAYVAGMVATIGGASPLVAIPVAGVAAAIFALALGYPILRLRGGYFAIATLGINEATRLIVANLSITGGGQGITMPVSHLSSQVIYGAIYYYMLAVMIATIAIIGILARRPFGFALRALRDEEEAAKVIGINTTWVKMLAWAISAFFTGLVGAGWAYWIAFFEPDSAFDVLVAVKGFLMMLVGGVGTVLGPAVGTFFISIVSEAIWSKFLNVHQLVLGLLIVVIIIALPKGFPSLRWPVRAGKRKAAQ